MTITNRKTGKDTDKPAAFLKEAGTVVKLQVLTVMEAPGTF
jgi:hypothetical protein